MSNNIEEKFWLPLDVRILVNFVSHVGGGWKVW